jgi:type I restriction enzyme S subunit
LPSLDEQRVIVHRVRAMLSVAERLAAEIDQTSATLDRACKVAVAKAFRGELVPTEAALAAEEGRDFESAEELLARMVAAPSSKTKRRTRVHG